LFLEYLLPFLPLPLRSTRLWKTPPINLLHPPLQVLLSHVSPPSRPLGTHLARLSLPTYPDLSSPPPPPSLEVPTIPVRNRRYAGVIAVDKYRLRDRASTLRPDQVTNLTTAANQIRPRLDGCMFCGDPPLSVLPFLQQLVRVADQSHMTEAALLWVVGDFLRPPAQGAFRSQRFDSWPLAIHWLLVTYASETILESAVRRIQTTSQATNESVQEFGLRLQV
jgi:hypothetical protein